MGSIRDFDAVSCITFLMYHYGAMTSVVSVLFNPKNTIVFASNKLEIVDFLEAIQNYKCNVLSGLPKILHSIINHPARKKYDLSSIMMCGSGGQSITNELITLIKQELNAKVFYAAYGSTELNNGLINIINLATYDPNTYRNCVGKPSAYMECKVVDPDTGKIQPFDVEGELHARSYSITRGYWNDEEKTRQVFDANGWSVKLIFL
jgi:fatty-acyl-CoA synthase